jgi:hypothetical protein
LALSGSEHQLLLLMQQILAFPVSFVDTDRPSVKFPTRFISVEFPVRNWKRNYFELNIYG